MTKKAVILLSGGLDSALNLALAAEKIALALTIDYGQRAVKREIQAAQQLTEDYHIKHELVKIDFLKTISAGALLGEQEVPTINNQQLEQDFTFQQQTAQKVWVPNRNALLINIAACFAEAQQLERIYVGFNAEEAQTFPDNSVDFMATINAALAFSTRSSVEVVSETIHMTKEQMLRKALEVNLPLEKIWSCYHGEDKPCQSCESCMRFQRAYRSVTGAEYEY